MNSKAPNPSEQQPSDNPADGTPARPDPVPAHDTGSSASEPKGDTASSPGHAPPSQDPADI